MHSCVSTFLFIQGLCFRAAFQSTLGACTYTPSAERGLSLKDSLRVMTSQTDQEIVFTAQHQNYTWLCVFVCVRENRVDWKQILCVPHSMRCPSVFLLQYAETAGKAVKPQISRVTHLCRVVPFKQIQSSVNSGLLVHCYVIIHVWVANKQFSCQAIERTCFI